MTVPSDLARITQAQKRLEEALRALEASGRLDPAAWDAVEAAERELAAAKGEEHAVPFDIGFVPEAAVSGAVLVQTESAAILAFNAMHSEADGSRATAGVGIIELEQCSVTKFGYPNDEALEGHPLTGRGLGAYGVFEVRNSQWVRSITEQNRVAFPDTPDSNERHFVFTFHDSTFECIAGGLRASLTTKPYAEVLADVSARVLGGGVARPVTSAPRSG